ncbi:protease pro-enzyme activation domain-containing protein [Amycolatopsis sp. DSM 110486]|uniref:S53 family peptidase n=1 Tax=Amycolatopsis sp. DSM 110486 TaxID=2865832 RepID=UPI001C6967DF|nr:S53 family peptidase [Amycolatopsis sp. DSM 110486]QYN22100.1 S53 family peptidase [Amycolatopsis sp. DSM 110486]
MISPLSAALTLTLLLGSAPSASATTTTTRDPVASDVVTPVSAGKNVGPATAVSGRVYLAGRDPEGLAAYAADVSDPDSNNYGHYLSATQALQRFGPTTQQADRVTGWLTSNDLHVTARTQNYVTFEGPASAVDTAFAVKLKSYTRQGNTYRSAGETPSVPAPMAHDILAVTGLDNTPRRAAPSTPGSTLPANPSAVDSAPAPVITDTVLPTDAKPEPVFRNSGPLSDYYGENVATTLPAVDGAKVPYAVRGYNGRQLRSAYGATPGMTGAGVKIAVITAYASPTLLPDLSQYTARNGDAAYRPDQVRQVTPAAYTNLDICDPGGQFGEQTLDTEAVHAIAVVSSASCHSEDFYDSIATVVDHHLADIVSNSWYAVDPVTPAQQTTVDNLLQLGAVQGIGFYSASGDNGDLGDFRLDGTHTGEVDFPARDPWVTAVGGTTLAIGAGDHELWETGWGSHSTALSADGSTWASPPSGFINGTGGGAVPGTPQPAYQRSIVPDALSHPDGSATPVRVSPDIAAVGDPTTGFITGDTQLFPDGTAQYNEHRIGGTSLAAPVIAGIQALAQQLTGKPLGFANPLIYQKYRSLLFRDPNGNPLGTNRNPAVVRVDFSNSFDASQGLVTTLRTANLDTSLTTTPGYDTTTGVGTPTAAYLASFARR